MRDDEVLREVTIVTKSSASRERVIALDHVEVRTTSRDALKASAISEGDLLSEASIERALAGVEREMATRRAIKLLEYRERSTLELRDRIVADGYPRDIAREVTERMTELGLVDDDRFAELFTRTKVAARWGRTRIERGLIAAGVDPERATEVIDHLAPRSGEVERAARLIPAIDPGDRLMREKQLRRLISRGFSYPDAREAVSRRAQDDVDQSRNESES